MKDILPDRDALDAVRGSGGGAFTATASLAAVRRYANTSAYRASKGAVTALVRALSVELAPEIRVNAVAPGLVATDIVRHHVEETGKRFEPLSLSASADKPDARPADPREMARVHLWLVSDDSSFVNGQTIVADNGRGLVAV